ncbi:MAG TPA: PHP-associated domain-containing protein [Dehalococcoidia bacterium]|nr:PHP-associated domain-containing protein [Dehalococcoidia bacterium]
MSKADIHIHSRYSDGLASVSDILDFVECNTDLDVVAVTDHEDVAGGVEARELAAKRGSRVDVVPGAEITTRHGHLLALFIERTPPLFRSVEATLEAIHSQGGFAIVPHPNSWLTRSISRRTIERVQRKAEPGVMFDGIETANPSPAGRIRHSGALELAARLGLAETGGSDAHHLLHIGRGWTEFDGEGADALSQALAAGEIRANMASYPSVREVGFGRIALGIGWGYTATPRKIAARGFSLLRGDR